MLNKFFSAIDNIFDSIKKPFYFLTIFIIYGSYLLFLLGIYYVNPMYVKTVFRYFEIFLCLFFIIRFNPFRTAVLRDFDQYLIFMSGFILLTNIGIVQYILNIAQKNQTLSDAIHFMSKTPNNNINVVSLPEYMK
jgi:hypothetical protein